MAHWDYTTYVDFTNFIVDGDGSNSSATNGGGPWGRVADANQGPVYTTTDATADGAGTTITDNIASWTGVQVDDSICFDTAGSKDWAIVTGISTNTITVSPAVTISAANKNVNVGGYFNDVTDVEPAITVNHKNAAADLICIWVANAASAYSPLVTPPDFFRWHGYNTTIGDLDWWSADYTDMPEIAGTSTTDGIALVSAYGQHFLCLNITAVSGEAVSLSGYYDNAFLGCRMHSTNEEGVYGINWRGCHLIGCLIEDCGKDGVNLETDAYYNSIFGCIIRGNTGDGLEISAGAHVAHCIIVDNTGNGIRRWQTSSTSPTGTFYNNIIADNGGDGIESTGAAIETWSFYNNVIADNAAWGIVGSNFIVPAVHGNVFHGNGSGTWSSGSTYFGGTNDLSTEPFVETTKATRTANFDYRLVEGMKNVGVPRYPLDNTGSITQFWVHRGPGLFRDNARRPHFRMHGG